MKANIFIGDHGTVSINLDHVESVESNGCVGSDLVVYMISGRAKTLKGTNANMFTVAWNKYIERD